MAMPIFAYEKVRPLRAAKGLGQAEIATELGLSRPTYVLIEQGNKEPTLSQVHILARLLGVNADELCTNLPTPNVLAVNYPKFKELVAACAAQGGNGSLTKTKLSLLTYLVDFAWHHASGQPMSGEVYRYTPRGPVADDFFRALDALYEAQAVAIEPQGATLLIRSIEPSQPVLMGSAEMTLLHRICAKWRPESTDSLAAFVRRRIEPKSPKPGEPIPYESILGEPASALY